MNRLNNFKNLNLILGWFVFAVSGTVYLLTMEPTTSFWDCSERIATSFTLGIGHPPGAPLFVMINRIFTLFAPDATKAARMINAASGIASGLTVAFLFWTITHLGRRLLGKKEGELSAGQQWVLLGAGLVGSLAFAFTDTLWFVSVEAETYALSTLITAIVFWAILKWENVAGEPHANRWLVLIAYLFGLSIGVHLLCLLAIPAVVFVYFFKMYPNAGKWGWVKATFIAIAILGFVFKGIITQTVRIGAWFDLFFVNSLGMPANSGLLFGYLLILALLAFGIFYTYKKKKTVLNTIFLCTAMVVLGYSSYASVVIRATANPPMNSNHPDNAFRLLYMLNREQYPSQPSIFKGQFYSSPIIDYTFRTSFHFENNRYIPYERLSGYKFPPEFKTVFPRMWDYEKESEYKRWVNVTGRNIPFRNQVVNVPTFGENLQFFFSYQLNFMYWRYFLWNFVGRQNDSNSQGELLNGNWMSGIPAIDQLYLGPQDNMPDSMANNRSRSTYFFLPFILGLIGLLYQLQKDPKNFVVVMWLFFMTGIAIILYLNQPPGQVRERDYAYAGSFYAFSIWIGLGVMWLYARLEKIKKLNNQKLNAAVATVICSVVPVLLIAQNWDGHTRARRYTARDIGYNYLSCLLPNAILMPYGDNDTFPLWYNQEVEGVRTDARVMNLSYLHSDWYIDQMRVRANDSDPVPFMIPSSKYFNVSSFPILQKEGVTGYVPLKSILEFVKSDNPRYKVEADNGELLSYIPTNKFAIPVNKENVLRAGIVAEKDSSLIVDTIYIDFKGNQLLKYQLAVYDMIASVDWTRPVYFTQMLSAEEFGLLDYLQLDGLSYRLVPIKTPGDYRTVGRIDTDYLYENMMNVFRYGNVKDPRVNTDYYVRYNFSATRVVNNFARLAMELVKEGKPEKAIEVMDRALEEVPFSQMGYEIQQVMAVTEAYYMAGAHDKANAVFDAFINDIKQRLLYFSQFKGRKAALISDEVRFNLRDMSFMYEIARRNGEPERANELGKYLKAVGYFE